MMIQVWKQMKDNIKYSNLYESSEMVDALDHDLKLSDCPPPAQHCSLSEKLTVFMVLFLNELQHPLQI